MEKSGGQIESAGASPRVPQGGTLRSVGARLGVFSSIRGDGHVPDASIQMM
jgi:hypothetical protein